MLERLTVVDERLHSFGVSIPEVDTLRKFIVLLSDFFLFYKPILSLAPALNFQNLSIPLHSFYLSLDFLIYFPSIVVPYRKFPHIRTYQNKNLEADFPELCNWQLRTCFSLMKYRFLLQG